MYLSMFNSKARTLFVSPSDYHDDFPSPGLAQKRLDLVCIVNQLILTTEVARSMGRLGYGYGMYMDMGYLYGYSIYMDIYGYLYMDGWIWITMDRI